MLEVHFNLKKPPDATRENINLQFYLGSMPTISVLCTPVPQLPQSYTASSATAIRQSPSGFGSW